MKSYQFHIKNMVCESCIYFVKNTLERFRAQLAEVELGRVSFLSSLENIEDRFESKLSEVGLSIIRTKNEILLESIKHGVGKYLDSLEEQLRSTTFSEFLQKRLRKNYNSLSKAFKEAEHITLESYIIAQKAERAKRLIFENELLLKEIAKRLHYSSLQHLSAQFRYVTGYTITHFKKQINSKSLPGSITNALSNLSLRGFNLQFEISEKHFWYDQSSKKVGPKETKLKEVYRFEDKPTRHGNTAIYEVETSDGVKGYVICQ